MNPRLLFGAAFAAALALSPLAAPGAGAATLCDVTTPLKLAALDSREGIYVGEWKDETTRVRSCMALAIERFNLNETVVAVYFFGPEPYWNIAKPGSKRQTYKLRDFDTLVLETLTDKYEFKLTGREIAATYTSPSGTIIKGKLTRRY